MRVHFQEFLVCAHVHPSFLPTYSLVVLDNSETVLWVPKDSLDSKKKTKCRSECLVNFVKHTLA